MAHLFLTVGDCQITVVQNDPTVDEVANHLVTAWEYKGDSPLVQLRMGEAEALALIGAWMTLESPVEGGNASITARDLVAKYLGEGWLP